MVSALDSDSSGLGTKNFLSFQNGARIADSLSMGKVASTLAKGSWIDMGNFKGIHLVKVLFQAFSDPLVLCK